MDNEPAGLGAALSRSQLRQVVETIDDPVMIHDAAGRYVWVNAAVTEFLGTPEEEVLGTYEAAYMDDETARRIERRKRAVVETEEPATYEVSPTFNDGTTRHFSTRRYPYYEDGDVVGTLAFCRDVTELKEQRRWARNQRDGIDLLNQMVRHDIRNDLQVVVTYAETLAEHVDAEGRDHLRNLRASADNAIELTESARDLTDAVLAPETDREPVSLRPALLPRIEQLRASHGDAEVTVAGSVPDVSVLADDMLESVFRNVLTNAVQHNDTDDPSVHVSVTLDEDVADVRIADDGPGIPERDREEILSEGVTDLSDADTGIGLYLVQTLLDRYDGTIHIADNDPRGTVFGIRLPLAE